ncbi:MAG: glycosyltransferase family 4 protein [Alphaproteobacteria bacterium]|nr:glycosyltransferase family 4 protein [Alphaproteobacteria bacterium]
MKIAQVCAVDFTFARFLLPLALAERDADHQVVAVCSPGPMLERVAAAGLRVAPVAIPRGLAPLALLTAYRALADLFRAERFDMVHAHTPVAAALARLAAWRAGVPRIVYTAHGFYFHDRMPWWRRASWVAAEWLLGRVTHVLFCQSAEDAAFARRLRLLPAGRPVEAIGNGVDPGLFAPPDAAARARQRAELKTPDDATVIVTVGRLVAEKGYAELIDAVGLLDAHLWIVGERLPSDQGGTVDGLLRAAASDARRGARLRLLGARDDVPAILNAADVFVLASHREGMPRSVIEAMMAGLPVVGTDIRGTREEVVNGVTGLLVPPRDAAALAEALGTLCADAGLRAAMGAAGRHRALENYDERVVIRRQLAVLGLTHP